MRSASVVVKRALTRGDPVSVTNELTRELSGNASRVSPGFVGATRGAPSKFSGWAPHDASAFASRASFGAGNLGHNVVSAVSKLVPTARAAARATQQELAALRTQARRFSSEGGKKAGGGGENFKPKAGGGSGKGPNKPNNKPGDDKSGKKSQSGEGSGNSGGNSSGRNGDKKDGGPKTVGELLANPNVANAIGTGLLLAAASLFLSSGSDVREISFQEFKTTLLEQGLVAKIEVSNKTQAKVFVRQGGATRVAPGGGADASSASSGSFGNAVNGSDGAAGKLMYAFNIGSLDSFERKMEEAQELLGIDSNDFVPVTYLNEGTASWAFPNPGTHCFISQLVTVRTDYSDCSDRSW